MSYVTYLCDTCLRQRELSNDGRRPDPLSCNITLRCRGRLSRVKVTSSPTQLVVPFVAGLDDYVPRGSSAAVATETEARPSISVVNSSTANSLTLAILDATTVGPTTTISGQAEAGNVSLESGTSKLPLTATVELGLVKVTSELLSYERFTFLRTGATQVLTGQDDSYITKNLRFTSDQRVKLIINGVEAPPSAFNTLTPNSITLTPLITGTNNLFEVIVYQELTSQVSATNTATLTFKRAASTDETSVELLSVSAWGDVDVVGFDGRTLPLLYCFDLTVLEVGASYFVNTVTGISSTGVRTELLATSGRLLMSKAPFSFSDKERFAYVKLSALGALGTPMTYERGTAASSIELFAPDATISRELDPISIITTNTVAQGDVSGSVSEGAEAFQSTMVIGPQ